MLLTRDPSRAGRRNVLLLGISYPCVSSHMAEHGFPEDIMTYKEPSVEQAVECVRRGILTEMDARDLARCVATEQATNTDVYSVSREIGAVYRSDRHVHCDFNARNFCKTLIRQFGPDIQFSQIILDYYWMPTGWLVTRWAKTLFQVTLPALVEHQMLTFPSKRKTRRRENSDSPPYDIDEGVVFLPFCAHVCKELVGAIHILEKYYEISFLDKKDLHGHSLWKGTMEIDANVMQERLGKRLDQEEVYCTFRPKDIYESMEDPHVRKSSVMEVLLAIKNYDDIRMVRLRPLRQHEKASVFRERLYKNEIGGFKGLDFDLSKRLQREMKKGPKKNKTLPVIEEEKKEDKTGVATTKKEEKKASAGRKKKASTTKTKKAKDPVVVKTKKKESEEKEAPASAPAPAPAPIHVPASEPEIESIAVEENEESHHFHFFPGPVRDLETYIDPQEMVAHEKERVAAMKKAERKKKAKNNKAKSAVPVSPRKGIVVLPGDKERSAKNGKPLTNCFIDEDSDFLAFNPRCPPVVKPWEQNDHARGRRSMIAKISSDEEQSWELDWSVIESRAGDEEEKDKAVPDALKISRTDDINEASLVYHGFSKGIRATDLDGGASAQWVALVDADGATDTVCVTVDTEKLDYQVLTGYSLESTKKLTETIQSEDAGEAALTAIIETCRGDWGELLEASDRSCLAKTAFKMRTNRVKVKEADGSLREIVVDRGQNLKTIVRWLILGRTIEEDPSGSLSLIERRLVENNPKWVDEPTGKLAVEIEKQLICEIKRASTKIPRDTALCGARHDDEMHQAIRGYLSLTYPVICDDDLALTMLALYSHDGIEGSELYKEVFTWLQVDDDSLDPTGDFRRVNRLVGESFDLTTEKRASEIARRLTGLVSLLSFSNEPRVDDSNSTGTSCKKGDALPSAAPTDEAPPRFTDLAVSSTNERPAAKVSAGSSKEEGWVSILNDLRCSDSSASLRKKARRSPSKSKPFKRGGKDPEAVAVLGRISQDELVILNREVASAMKEGRSTNTVEAAASTKSNYHRTEDDSGNGTVSTAKADAIRKTPISKRIPKGGDSLSQTAVVAHSTCNESSATKRKVVIKNKKKRLKSSSFLEDKLPSSKRKRTASSLVDCLGTALPITKARDTAKSRKKATIECPESATLPSNATPQPKALSDEGMGSVTLPGSKNPGQALVSEQPRGRTSRSNHTCKASAQEATPQPAPIQATNNAILEGRLDVERTIGQMSSRGTERGRRGHAMGMDILGRLSAGQNHSLGFVSPRPVPLLHKDSKKYCLVMEEYAARCGMALEQYEMWIRGAANSIGVERVTTLQRICIWLASDGRIFESENDRTSFTAIYSQIECMGLGMLADKDPITLTTVATNMELVHSHLLDMTANRFLSMAQDTLRKALFDLMQDQIHTWLDIPNHSHSNHQSPFSLAGGRPVTPREASSPSMAPSGRSTSDGSGSRRVVTLDPYISNVSGSPAPYLYKR